MRVIFEAAEQLSSDTEPLSFLRHYVYSGNVILGWLLIYSLYICWLGDL